MHTGVLGGKGRQSRPRDISRKRRETVKEATSPGRYAPPLRQCTLLSSESSHGTPTAESSAAGEATRRAGTDIRWAEGRLEPLPPPPPRLTVPGDGPFIGPAWWAARPPMFIWRRDDLAEGASSGGRRGGRYWAQSFMSERLGM